MAMKKPKYRRDPKANMKYRARVMIGEHELQNVLNKVGREDPMLAMLIAVGADMEDRVHQDGWDKMDAGLASLHRKVDDNGLAIFPAPVPMPELIDPDAEVADVLAIVLRQMKRTAITFDNLAGFFFVTEGFAGALPNDYEHGQIRDRPDSLEVRMATVIDTARNCWGIQRFRDVEGRALTELGVTPDFGAVPTLLSQMVDAVNNPIPEG